MPETLTNARASWWRDLARLDAEALDVRAGLRIAAVVVAPSLLGLLTHRSGAGLVASLGALNVVMADGAGTYRSRLHTLLAAWLLVTAVLGVVGPAGDVVGLLAGVLFVIGLGMAAPGVVQVGEAVAWCLVGGAWAVLSTALLWPLRQHLPEHRAVGLAVASAADVVAALARTGGAGGDVQRDAEGARVELDRARATVLSAVPRRQVPPRDARVLLDVVDSTSSVVAVAPALGDVVGTGYRARAPSAVTAGGTPPGSPRSRRRGS